MSPTRATVLALALAALSALWLPAWLSAAAIVCVLTLFVADALAVRRPPEVRRDLPGEVVRGVPAPFSVVVEEGPSKVRVRQPQTADVRFEPSEADGGLGGEVVAARRGRHQLAPVVTRSTGPLGLGRWQHRHGATVEVASHADLPGARRVAQAVQQGRFRDPGLRRGPLGLGTEFETVRDYTPDDDVRRMNWRATERTGRPMVNQYREDTDRELWCLIDSGRLLGSPVGSRTRLDVCLDAVAAVAAVGDVLGDRVGAVAFDDEVRRTIAPKRAAAAHLVRAVEDLEPTTTDSDYDAAFAAVTRAKRSLVIVFTDLLDVAAARPLIGAMGVLARRHAVVVAGVSDPDLERSVHRPPRSARDPYVATVARDLLDERAVAAAQLTAAGAVVLDAPVDSFPSACVGAYLRLKARARI